MAITVLIMLQLLTGLLYYTPVAILSSIILSALPGLINYSEAYNIWKVDKLDFLACAGAFFGVLFASVEMGLMVADQEHEIEHDEELDEEQEPRPQRNRRGPTKRKASSKVKWKPQYDQYGRPDGDHFLDYSGQLGVITRTKVPINIETWKKVDKKVKDQIWLEAKAYYKIPDDTRKKQALVQAGGMWKAFKTRLRSEYMDLGLSPCKT